MPALRATQVAMTYAADFPVANGNTDRGGKDDVEGTPDAPLTRDMGKIRG